jgi:hypothetical protein
MFKDGRHLDVIDELSKMKISKSKKGPLNIYKYLCNNINNINYKSYLENNWFIGSGVVESGNKTVLQKRLKGAGMRWSVSSAQNMVTLKAKNESLLWYEQVIKPVYLHFGLPLK